MIIQPRKLFTKLLLFQLVLFTLACTEQDVLPEARLTVAEVQKALAEHRQAQPAGREVTGEIQWNEAEQRQISLGEALVFPVQYSETLYASVSASETAGNAPLTDISSGAWAMAYRQADGEIMLHRVHRMQTAHTEEFTGYILVSNWDSEPGYVLEFRDGEPIAPVEAGRTESCYFIHHWECTSVSAGGVDYGGHCTLKGVTHFCPPKVTELAPADFGGFGGGGGGDDGGNKPKLCPHPFLDGQYITCGTCVEGYEKDANGNCIKVREDIFLQVTDECLKEAILNILTQVMNSELQSAILNIYGGNNPYSNMMLQQSSSLPKLARTEFSNTRGIMSATITINHNRLYGASQEYLSIIIGHELLHAYLNAIGFNRDQSEQHKEMITNYLSWITDFLSELYPNLSSAEVKSLSIRTFDELRISNPILFSQILAENGFNDSKEVTDLTDSYRDGEKGKSCLK